MTQNKSDKKLFIIDGHAIAYRAYYALIKTPLTNAKEIGRAHV
jgi:5'-3' exonuclease